MVMFVYTKNMQVIEALEKDGNKFIKKGDDDTFVYALSPTSKFQFDDQKETYISNKLRF